MMADQLNWTPGHDGKGVIINGEVHTWNSDRWGAPHHPDYLYGEIGQEAGGAHGRYCAFYIRPDGGVVFSLIAAGQDPSLIEKADPRLHVNMNTFKGKRESVSAFAAELKLWLDNFKPAESQALMLSPHHESPQDFLAAAGDTAKPKPKPQRKVPRDIPENEWEFMKQEWAENEDGEGRPYPFPPQPVHWRHDHLPHLESALPKTWRNERTWEGWHPQQKATMRLLKSTLPNTKYGNSLAPWLQKMMNKGHVRQKDMWDEYGESMPEAWMNWEKTDPPIEGEEQEFGAPGSNLVYPTRWGIPGWRLHDSDPDYVPDFEDIVMDLIERQKELKRTGVEINPMDYGDPQSLLKALEGNRTQMLRERGQGKLVHELPGGWTVRKLVKPQDFQYEGNAMDHCVADYADDPDYRGKVYSLRDKKGRPHVTWFYDKGENEMNEIYGKGDSEPKSEYKDRVRQWVESLPKRPPAEDVDVPTIRHHSVLEQGETPYYDEYGRQAEPQYEWGDLVTSAFTHPPGVAAVQDEQRGFYPENIEAVQNAAKNTNQTWDLERAAQGLATQNRQAIRRLRLPPDIEQQVLQSPWQHTLEAFTGEPTDWPTPSEQNRAWNVQSKVAATTHIGIDGKQCHCPYGENRPVWTPEWDQHTNWDW